jgi:hypothetical protein
MARAWMIPVVLQIALPIALLTWQAAGSPRARGAWLLRTLIVAGYILVATVAGVWLVAPVAISHGFLTLSGLIAVISYPGAAETAVGPPRTPDRMVFALQFAVLAVVIGAVATVLVGRIPPRIVAVDLEFPLRHGTYAVANGGRLALINAHVSLMNNARFARFRGAGYAIDVVKLNDSGGRADGVVPRDPARYAIFGEPIYAPCEGIVARSEDGLPDLAPPEVDRTHLPGNFVLLECEDLHVLLAHMRRGSVNVHPGDYVTTETILGEVGNSGNSDEPHLHIHAQRPGVLWDPFKGDPLPMRFEGRFLVRNDRITRLKVEGEHIDD